MPVVESGGNLRLMQNFWIVVLRACFWVGLNARSGADTCCRPNIRKSQKCWRIISYFCFAGIVFWLSALGSSSALAGFAYMLMSRTRVWSCWSDWWILLAVSMCLRLWSCKVVPWLGVRAAVSDLAPVCLLHWFLVDWSIAGKLTFFPVFSMCRLATSILNWAQIVLSSWVRAELIRYRSRWLWGGSCMSNSVLV